MTVATTISIRPIRPHVGVELTGLDLSGTLDDRTVAALRDAVARHHVAVVRGQTLDVDQHARLTATFGRPPGSRGTPTSAGHPIRP